MSLLQLPIAKFKSLNLTTSFLNGSSPLLVKPSPCTHSIPLTTSPTTIRAIKTMQGRVIGNRNDKTVNVEVVRLAPHPKYKRRIRKIKKYQAHDPDNSFKVGDLVQLQKIRPISKTKTFLAVAAPRRDSRKTNDEEDVEEASPQDLQLPLESQQE